MTWKEAIILVLKNNYRNKEYVPMHYKDITDKILSNGLIETEGATPSMTVSRELTTNHDYFIKMGGGYFGLSDVGRQYANNSNTYQSSDLEQETQEENISNDLTDAFENAGVIRHFGVFWNRELVDWRDNTFKLQGKDSPSAQRVIDFTKMRGVYLLYDYREVVYVGQATGGSSIAKRLKDHTRDRLANRWNRFSWFGIDSVDEATGHISLSDTYLTISLDSLVDALEGLLIEGIEPRQNRKRGDNFGNEYCQFVPQMDGDN